MIEWFYSRWGLHYLYKHLYSPLYISSLLFFFSSSSTHQLIIISRNPQSLFKPNKLPQSST